VSSACTRSESVLTTAWRASLRGLSLGNVVIASAPMYLACRSTLIVSLLFGLFDRTALAACVAFSSSLIPTICVGAADHQPAVDVDREASASSIGAFISSVPIPLSKHQLLTWPRRSSLSLANGALC